MTFGNSVNSHTSFNGSVKLDTNIAPQMTSAAIVQTNICNLPMSIRFSVPLYS